MLVAEREANGGTGRPGKRPAANGPSCHD